MMIFLGAFDIKNFPKPSHGLHILNKIVTLIYNIFNTMVRAYEIIGMLRHVQAALWLFYEVIS